MFNFEKIFEEEEKQNKKRLDEYSREKKYGTPPLPREVRLYNKHQKRFNSDRMTSIEYHEKYDNEINGSKYEVDRVMDIIESTIWFFKEVFKIDLDHEEAANVSSDFFKLYVEGIDEEWIAVIDSKILLYKKALKVLRIAHDIDGSNLKKTQATLEALDLDCPLELKMAIAIQKKYHKNQKRKALKSVIQKLFPEIKTKFILDKIVKNAL